MIHVRAQKPSVYTRNNDVTCLQRFPEAYFPSVFLSFGQTGVNLNDDKLMSEPQSDISTYMMEIIAVCYPDTAQ